MGDDFARLVDDQPKILERVAVAVVDTEGRNEERMILQTCIGGRQPPH
jgi:hypothetical protein